MIRFLNGKLEGNAGVYGGYSVKTGCYSSAAARDILQTRREIKAYLEKYDFI